MEPNKTRILSQLEGKLLTAISKGQSKNANNTLKNIVNRLVEDPNSPDWIESMERCDYFDILAGKLLRQAVVYGQLEIIKMVKIWFQEENYESYIGDVLFMAAINNHMEIFKLLVSWGAGYNSNDLLEAIENHRPDIVKLLLKSGARMEIDKTPVIAADDFKKSVLKALENNQIEVVIFLIMFNPSDMKNMLFFSCRGYQNRGYPPNNHILNSKEKVSESTWLEIINFLGKYGGSIQNRSSEKNHFFKIDVINRALQLVADDNKLTLMKRLKEWGATDFNTAMIWAAEGHHPKAMKLLKIWGATNYEMAKSRSSKYVKFEIISWLRSLNGILYPPYTEMFSPTTKMSDIMKENVNISNKGEWNIVYWECMSCYMQWQPGILNAWRREYTPKRY